MYQGMWVKILRRLNRLQNSSSWEEFHSRQNMGYKLINKYARKLEEVVKFSIIFYSLNWFCFIYHSYSLYSHRDLPQMVIGGHSSSKVGSERRTPMDLKHNSFTSHSFMFTGFLAAEVPSARGKDAISDNSPGEKHTDGSRRRTIKESRNQLIDFTVIFLHFQTKRTETAVFWYTWQNIPFSFSIKLNSHFIDFQFLRNLGLQTNTFLSSLNFPHSFNDNLISFKYFLRAQIFS